MLAEMCVGIYQMHEGKQYKKLGYQNFEDYCRQEFDFSKQQGIKYVNVGKAIDGENDNSGCRFEDIGNFERIGINKLHLLAMLDEEDRQEVIETVDVESATVRELKAQIAALKQETATARQESTTALQKMVAAESESADLGQRLDRELERSKALEAENAELLGDRQYLMDTLQDAENELKELRDQPIEHAVMEDTQSREELERMRGLMEKQSEGFSQREVALRAEYEDKLKQAMASGDTKEMYKMCLENARQEIAKLKSFLRRHPEHGDGRIIPTLDGWTTYLLQQMEGLV